MMFQRFRKSLSFDFGFMEHMKRVTFKRKRGEELMRKLKNEAQEEEAMNEAFEEGKHWIMLDDIEKQLRVETNLRDFDYFPDARFFEDDTESESDMSGSDTCSLESESDTESSYSFSNVL